MTPIEVIQEQISRLNESGIVRATLRHAGIAMLCLLGFGVFLVIMFFVTDLLYLLLGGWGVALGVIATLGLIIGAMVTMSDLA